jgi:tetratricopeptide (TPR) repeat protein/class 3 adenylate cyclase
MSASKHHRHAAIMFTDIMGYTALMGSDEDLAFNLLQKNREIHKQLIKKFQGDLIKEIGDGMLASFPLASYAVRCAQTIQIEAGRQGIPLKIGIHQGEIVFDGKDVFGDGVNIASRLQESAQAGSILISGTVYNDIRNKPDIQVQFIKEEHFKNVAEPVKVFQVSSEGSVKEFIPEKLEKRLYHRKSFFTRPLIRISFAMITVAVVIIFLLFYSGTSLPFKERDWVVISDFENLTGEPIFDQSLNTAFRLTINQSRYVNVITRQRLLDALKRMKNDQVETIDEETGREIAMREGVKLCIAPSISRVGTQYILTAKILNAESADVLQSEVLYVENQDEIIKRLDRLSKKIRSNLGESQYKILQQSKPLAKATTSSLDALKEYSLGIEKHLNLEFEEAIVHYKNAIGLDSNFTAAKASLGNLLMEKFDRKEGVDWLNQAISSIGNLTDREKYGILAFYAVNVENDLDKGIQYTRERLALYPDDPQAHNNLGWYYQNRNQYESAAEEYKKAIRIDPFMALTYSGLIWIYLTHTGQLDSAKKWTDKMMHIAPDNPWVYFNLGNYYVAKDRLEDAQREYRKAKELNPSFLLDIYRLAHVLRLQGKYEEAKNILKDILSINPQESAVYYNLGLICNLTGDTVRSKEHFLKHLGMVKKWMEVYPEDPMTYIWNGLALLRIGKIEEGWEMSKKAIEMDTSAHFEYAQFLAAEGNHEEALDQLKMAFENGFRNLTWLKLQPDLQSLHHDPQFRNLISTYFDQ